MIRTRQKVEAILQKYKNLYEKNNIKDIEFQLGIDEAGRGPVFGSMIYSALWWPIALKQQLGQIGFQDSKVLTQEKREQLLRLLDSMRGKLIFYQVKELTAQCISTNMLSVKNSVNLNELSHSAALQLLKGALSQGFKITHVYVDTVGDPNKYRQFFINNIPQYLNIVKEIVVQPKADRDHKVVSASSICAKVTRDYIISNWKFTQNLNYVGQLGSGYPADPITKKWLEVNKNDIFGFPDIVRFSWSTSVNSLQNVLKLKMREPQEEKDLKGFSYFKNKKDVNQDLFDIVPIN